MDNAERNKAQNQTRMNRHARYNGNGSCIYCGEIESSLTDEHIIPEAIGGRLIIEKASCKNCAAQTHAFEGHAIHVYNPLRRQLNFPSKQRGKKDKARRQAERFILRLDNRTIHVPSEEFPALLVFLTFPLPGILLNMAPDDAPMAGGIHGVELMPEFGRRLNEIKRKYRCISVSIVGVDKSDRMDEGDFGRMLAKIAHAYAVAELGNSGFRSFLVPLILGQKPYYLRHYVGSQIVTEAPATDLHEISFDNSGVDRGSFLIVRIRLFAIYRSPAHLVVVGLKNSARNMIYMA